MDKSSFSRMISNPTQGRTLERIALGLGITVEQLLDEEDRDVLLSDHPVVVDDMGREDRISAISTWCSSRIVDEPQKRNHRSDEARYKRRKAVQKLLEEGRFSPDSVRDLAARFKVSSSLIYSDRSLLKSMMKDS